MDRTVSKRLNNPGKEGLSIGKNLIGDWNNHTYNIKRQVGGVDA